MDAVEYLKQLKKMCSQYADCHSCPFGENRSVCSTPEILKEPEKIVEAVEKWTADHLVKTRQSEFLKMFPNATTKLIGNCEVLVINPCQIERGYEKTEHCTKCDECLKDYWLAEVDDENKN